MASPEELPLLEEPPSTAPPCGSSHTMEDTASSLNPNGCTIYPQESVLDEPSSPPRSLTGLEGLALVIGLQIGSGIFSAPAVVISKVLSPTTAILVWFLSGLLVWTGALSFAELGNIVPHNGGIQEYLRHCYGDLAGFVFAWTWLFISRPCAMGMVSLVFAEYLFAAISPDTHISVWMLKATALIAIISITSLNCMGTRTGMRTAVLFLVLKIFGLGSIAIIGLFLLIKNHQTKDETHLLDVQAQSFVSVSHTTTKYSGLSIWTSVGNFTDAVIAALFAYGGWESVGFITGEIKNPHYTLGRILNRSMGIVTTLFVTANIAFYSTLSLKTLQETNAVATEFGRKVFGEPGSITYTWVVCLSCLGALNAVVFSTGRLTQAADARRYLPAFLRISSDSRGKTSFLFFRKTFPSWTHAKDQNIPIVAMVLNAIIAAVYVAIGEFRELLIFKGIVEYTVYFVTVVGLLMLRFSRADTDRRLSGQYHTRIIYPFSFCCVTALVIIRSTIAHPLQGLLVVALFGVFSCVYHTIWGRRLCTVGGVLAT